MKVLTAKLITLLGLLVIGATAAYGSEQPKMNGKLRIVPMKPEHLRYTGKPYSKALGAYVFNYRNYDPQIARWTTPDPSGFPDGANNRTYAPVPTGEVDSNGLYITGVSAVLLAAFPPLGLSITAWDGAEAAAAVAGYKLIVQAMVHAESGNNWVFSSDESKQVLNSNLYQTQVSFDAQSYLNANINSSTTQLTIPKSALGHYDFENPDEELSWALHGITFSGVRGTVDFDQSNQWTYNGKVTFEKAWTFSTHLFDGLGLITHPWNGNGVLLQSLGLINSYQIFGSFQDTWTE